MSTWFPPMHFVITAGASIIRSTVDQVVDMLYPAFLWLLPTLCLLARIRIQTKNSANRTKIGRPASNQARHWRGYADTHHPAATQLAEERLHVSGASALGPADALPFAEEGVTRIYQTESAQTMAIIMLSARFLPALVEAYIYVPHIVSSYGTMLRSVLHPGYFEKLMRGFLGHDLYKLQAEHLAELDFGLDVVRSLSYFSVHQTQQNYQDNAEGMEIAIVTLIRTTIAATLTLYLKHRRPGLIPMLRSVQDIYTGKLQNIYAPRGEISPDLNTRHMQRLLGKGKTERVPRLWALRNTEVLFQRDDHIVYQIALSD
ncbi:hypothetical protein B0H10DRAFT_1959722 [Mycena sp. CBHHK59/15]|nr:hypothetical protein B0H10DRAFT_1959722 [Mycena sp. CBHHK59/15]